MFLEIDKKPADSIAVIDNYGQKITYGELCNLCIEDADLVKERSVVFILCKNTVGAVAEYIYCLENHIVPLLLSASIDEILLQNLMEIYKPSYIFHPKDMDFPGNILKVRFDYCVKKLENSQYPISNNLELLMSTSGSTGSPKLVRYKTGNLESNAMNVARAFDWNTKERPICDLAMNYTMGLNVINTHLFVGCTVVLTTYNILSMDFWNFVKEQKCTNFTGVPFSYELMTKIRVMRMDLPYLTTFAQGGGKLTDKMFSDWSSYAEKNGKRFIATFGTTETSARMTYLPHEKSMERIGSIGKAIPGGKLFLLDENGKEIEASEGEGELGYQGPNVTMGYAENRDDLAKEDEFKGVYHTGDIARRDKDGYYYIVGRKSKFLKLLGYRVNLEQCERLIKEMFQVDCACVGTDKKMIVYAVMNNSVTSDKIIEYLSNKLDIYNSLFEVRFIKNIPKNDTGKVMYTALPVE